MIEFDELTNKYIKTFPEDQLALEYFGLIRDEEVIEKFERAFKENKPLTEIYPEIKKFCNLIKRGIIHT
jgi:hypothetical protein